MTTSRISSFFASAIVVSLISVCAMGQDFMPPGAPGLASPTNWKSSNNDVILRSSSGEDILSIVGNGESTEWTSAPISFESGKPYRLRFKASVAKDGSGDCLCAGTNFANVDFSGVPLGEEPMQNYSFVFTAPDGKDGVVAASTRFAQWTTRREYRVSNVELSAVAPVFTIIKSNEKSLLLGDGESLDRSGVYSYRAFRTSETSNYERPLYSSNAHFNTDRWMIDARTTHAYRFSLEPFQMRSKESGAADSRFEIVKLPRIPFTGGRVAATVGYYLSGKVVVEVGTDGQNWIPIAEFSGLETKEVSLDSLFNGRSLQDVFVRLRGDEVEPGKGCNLQIHDFNVELQTAEDADAPLVGRGTAIYADLGDEIDATKPEAYPWAYDDEFVYARSERKVFRVSWDDLRASQKLSSQLETLNPREARASMIQMDGFQRKATLVKKFYPFYIQNYSNRISALKNSDPNVDLSWCDADYKVPRDPQICEFQPAKEIMLRAAKNDAESFQVILCPKTQALRNVRVEVLDDLSNGKEIAATRSDVQTRYAYYHYVDEPTDRTCAPGWYPDALAPFEGGADGLGAPVCVDKGRNFLIWTTVKIPANVSPGEYRSRLRITANDGAFEAIIPFGARVFDVVLPEKNTIESAYGVSPSNVWRYHNCKSEADKRAIFEKYLALYGEYRMSIYHPAPLDPISVEWRPDANPPQCELKADAFLKETKRVFDKYHFTNFLLPVQGLGGGSFDSRYEGSVAGFKPDSPEYDAMMTDYGAKLQSALEDAGLLDAAYVYCFDEPEEKDYEFVANEFAKLKKFFPKIARMLTEEPSPAFEKILEDAGGKVDVWCPVSYCYSHERSQPQRRAGSRFWWYVCTGPKAPFCTEFTDHPAQEMRIWLWQAFEREIVGTLIWETTYWNSPSLFGDSFQNPYEDPESYMTGYGLAPGVRRAWGNGDGRFVYPPLNAATPGMNDGKPVLDPPNASIRLEMYRAGVQDYELLLIFKRLLNEKRDALTKDDLERFEKLLDFDPITTDETHFSDDPQVLLNRRAEILEAAEFLKRVK